MSASSTPPPDRSPTALVLAGDIGGTKTNLAIFSSAQAGLRSEAAASFTSADFSGLAGVVRAFRDSLPSHLTAGRLAAACFGVAGPVIGNRSRTPNLAWEIDGGAVAAAEDLPAVQLINDLVATAEGIPLLGPDELASLQDGAADSGGAGSAAGAGPGNQALIAAGTGLGMALMPWVDGRRVTIASEGGHADFAPRDEEEAALLVYLRRRFGEHVSVERVVSGRGLKSVYEFLRDTAGLPENPRVAAAMARGDAGQAISEAALDGSDALSDRALNLFVAAYGAAAGNLALTATAADCVYIGGGIAPKILPRLRAGSFMRAFRDKGRLEDLLARIAVRVILNDRTALLGAARCAARQAHEKEGRVV